MASPGWNDCCVEEILRIPRLLIPSLKIIDFAGDLMLVGSTGAHDELAVDIVTLKCFLDRFGVRYHTRKGKHWWPTKVIPRLGLVVVTDDSVVRMEDEKLSTEMSLRRGIFGLQPDSTMSARALLSSVAVFTFFPRLPRVVPSVSVTSGMRSTIPE